MTKLLFPVSSTPGRAGFPREGQGRLINAYAEKIGERTQWGRVPGLVQFADTGEANCRGFIEVGGSIYVACGNKVKLVNSAGVVTALTGTLPGSDAVTFARNNKSPTPDVVVVADSTAFVCSTSALSAYPDSDVASPQSVTTLDGYFEFQYGDGSTRASDLNSTAINSLSIAKAESRPDGLLRVVIQGQQVLKMGTQTIEFWQNVGASPYPFSRVTSITTGLAARHAIAGFEDGWTGPILFVASDNSVRKLSGYTPERVSSAAVERDIAALATRSTLEASVHVFEGQQIWSLTAPGLWTWEFNASTGAWHERQSYLSPLWRGRWSVRAFDKWIVGDRNSSKLFTVSTDAYREHQDPLVWRLESALTEKFPTRATVRRCDLKFLSTGAGQNLGIDPIETNPQVGLDYSDDGGSAWSAPLLRTLGVEGQRDEPIRFNRLGRTSLIGRRWRVTVADPVPVVFEGGVLKGKL